MNMINHESARLEPDRPLIPAYRRTKSDLIRSSLRQAYQIPAHNGRMSIPYMDYITYRWCKKCN